MVNFKTFKARIRGLVGDNLHR